MAGLFVTGTDTGVGKTVVAVALIEKMVAEGREIAAMKPVATGCERRDGCLVNDDALALAAAANVDASYEQINPYAFEPPIAPHIAALDSQTTISPALIKERFEDLARRSEFVVVEGAGGVCVPLDDTLYMFDLIDLLDLPAMLVVGMRLGCINHALLSVEALAAREIELTGWVANHIDPDFARAGENVASLCARIGAPLICEIPFCAEDHAAREAARGALRFCAY